MSHCAAGQESARRRTAAPRGFPQKVAVGCWFTATGRAIPKMLKYEDAAGLRHTVYQIQILNTNQLRNTHVLLLRYDCRAIMQGRQRDFTLLYHPRENTWDMLLRG